MPSYLAELSWAKVMPPSPLMAASPLVPSDAVPERIDSDRVTALICGQRAQKDVDGGVDRSRLFAFRDMQQTFDDGHLAIARDDIGAVGRDRHAVFHLDDSASWLTGQECRETRSPAKDRDAARIQKPSPDSEAMLSEAPGRLLNPLRKLRCRLWGNSGACWVVLRNDRLVLRRMGIPLRRHS